MHQRRLAALAALCDTFVPAVEPPAVERDDPTGFWARRATDLDVHVRVAQRIEDELPRDDRAGLERLLDVLAAARLPRLPLVARESLVRALSAASGDARRGLEGLRSLTLMEFYSRPGPGGGNPNWDHAGYPGPPPTREPGDPPLPTEAPDGPVIEADAVVVGSGSGGGVIAAVLAGAGWSVVVLEAGGAPADADLPTDELTAMRELYWRGGPTLTADGNVVMLAGATLGGGSTVNWQNCVAPPAHVRGAWAEDHGLRDVATESFDAHLDAVRTRISATAEATDLNGPNERLARGADALGWSWHRAERNVDLARYDAASAGHVGFGDRSGAKQGTVKTYLRDAVAAGARLVVGARARRVLVEGGRAVGVEATVVDGIGGQRPLTVRARHVVVAGGALETPALLLRSGLGGPAAGRFLRLHPVPTLPGFYGEPTRPWWGPPQACVVDEHAGPGDGFLVETPHLHLGLAAAAVPWRSGRDHKLVVGRSSEIAPFIAVCRDRGHGRVTIDGDGEAVVSYPLDHAVDDRVIRDAVRAMVRLHAAAGARAIVDLHPRRRIWRRGDDVEAYADAIGAAALGAGGRVLFSAHQMGSARLGLDPGTSVANPRGELHTTRGVWIGDTSAFPTAVGSNPMLTCMALARRTAGHVLDA